MVNSEPQAERRPVTPTSRSRSFLSDWRNKLVLGTLGTETALGGYVVKAGIDANKPWLAAAGGATAVLGGVVTAAKAWFGRTPKISRPQTR